MTKILTAFIFSFWMNLHLSMEQVQIVYLEQQPKVLENQTYYKIEADNYLNRIDVLLVFAEKKLTELAEKEKSGRIEIFIIEQENGEIPTES